MKKNKTLLLIAGVFTLLLMGAVGAGAAYVFVLKKHQIQAHGHSIPERYYFSKPLKLKTSLDHMPANYPSSKVFVSIQVSFAAHNSEAIDALQKIDPAIQGALLANLLANGKELLSSHKSDRKKFETQCLSTVNDVMSQYYPKYGKTPFRQVFLTHYVSDNA